MKKLQKLTVQVKDCTVELEIDKPISAANLLKIAQGLNSGTTGWLFGIAQSAEPPRTQDG
jgi:hypothetical protein